MNHYRQYLVTLALCCVAQAGQADEPISTVGTSISVSGKGDNAETRHRIAIAIEEMCRSYGAVEPYQHDEITKCRALAWRSVEPQLSPHAADASGAGHKGQRPRQRQISTGGEGI